MVFYEFLIADRKEIMALTEKKTLALTGLRPSSNQLKRGLPAFYTQMLALLRAEHASPAKSGADGPAMAMAHSRSEDAQVAREAGLHGEELLRLGYTLSHVVHAYGAMCQAITELAAVKNITITAIEFHNLNRCLDIAIAGAVTDYQSLLNSQESDREVEHLGFLAHELRNALSSANISLHLIQNGTVGFEGSTGRVLKRSMKRLEEIIDRSLTDVRLRSDPRLHVESVRLIQIVDQIVLTADVEAKQKNQSLSVEIDPELIIEADQQLFHSALSNLIQNALKYSRIGGRILVRGRSDGDRVVVEVEDECGGLASGATAELFKPFEQQNENRKGLGLGLTIAQRAIALNHGTVEVRNVPGKGCVFSITLPRKAATATSAA